MTAITVTGRKAKAALVLRKMQSVESFRPPANSNNLVMGLLNAKTLTCNALMGDQLLDFDVALETGNSSSLLTSCMAANKLVLYNNGGQCVQVVGPQAKQVNIFGDRTHEVVWTDATLPSSITMHNLSSLYKPPSTKATRVLLEFSTSEADGKRIKKGAVTITGNVLFDVPQGKYAVLVRGCGVDKFTINVKDPKGKNVALVKNVCRSTVAAAKADLQGLLKKVPCFPPIF